MALRQALIGHAQAWRRRDMTALLVLLTVSVFVIPVVAPGGIVLRSFNALLYLLILGTGAAAVAARRALLLVLVGAGAAAIALLVAEHHVAAPVLQTLRGGITLAALGVLIALFGKRVFGPGDITLDRLMGAVALYLLLGVIFAAAYELVADIDRAAFAPVVAKHDGDVHWAYFSFVTLTTVGYGDILPVSRAARSLAMFEALVGQLYPAIVLGRFVANMQLRR